MNNTEKKNISVLEFLHIYKYKFLVSTILSISILLIFGISQKPYSENIVFIDMPLTKFFSKQVFLNSTELQSWLLLSKRYVDNSPSISYNLTGNFFTVKDTKQINKKEIEDRFKKIIYQSYINRNIQNYLDKLTRLETSNNIQEEELIGFYWYNNPNKFLQKKMGTNEIQQSVKFLWSNTLKIPKNSYGNEKNLYQDEAHIDFSEFPYEINLNNSEIKKWLLSNRITVNKIKDNNYYITIINTEPINHSEVEKKLRNIFINFSKKYFSAVVSISFKDTKLLDYVEFNNSPDIYFWLNFRNDPKIERVSRYVYKILGSKPIIQNEIEEKFIKISRDIYQEKLSANEFELILLNAKKVREKELIMSSISFNWGETKEIKPNFIKLTFQGLVLSFFTFITWVLIEKITIRIRTLR